MSSTMCSVIKHAAGDGGPQTLNHKQEAALPHRLLTLSHVHPRNGFWINGRTQYANYELVRWQGRPQSCDCLLYLNFRCQAQAAPSSLFRGLSGDHFNRGHVGDS